MKTEANVSNRRDTRSRRATTPGADRTRRRPVRGPVLCLALALTAALATGALPRPAAAATPPAWSVLGVPWTDAAPVHDLSAAAPAFVAAAGAGGRVAVSGSGGLKWTMRSPASQGVTADLFGVAFADAAHGVVVGAAGTVLVTDDGGQNWGEVGFSGLPPTADLHDVSLVGPQGIAVGDRGTVIETANGGKNWQVMTRPTTADLYCVALADDGSIVIGGAGGLVIVRRGGHTSTFTAPAEITSVAAARTPSWGDGTPDVVVTTGWEVLGSDDGVELSPLFDPSAATQPPWSAASFGGVPAAEILLAGAPGVAAYYALGTSAWNTGSSGLTDARAAAEPGGQSVAYVLGGDSRVTRTLSAGRSPSTITPSATSVKAGQTVTLAATARIAAPGRLVLEHRAVGGVWKAADSTDWTSADWGRQAQLRYKPTLNNDFRLRFVYGTGGSVVSTTRRVSVSPRLTPDKLRITVSRGKVYRFKGTVYPALRGEKVELFTDRGGKWRRVSLGGVVKLLDGTRWVSRQFGTPVRETYHLRATIQATSRHEAARSATVTVVVR